MGETIAQNRRARHEFTIEDTFEAGIVLRGTEIKSVRAHKVSLADAYARIDRDEAWIVGLHIAPWESADVRFNHEPKRARKLLLHRHEIDELLGKTKAKGLTHRAAPDLHHRPGKAKVRAGARPRQADLGPAARDRRPGREARPGPPGGRRPASAEPATAEAGRRDGCGSRGCSRRSTSHAAGEPGRVIVGGVLDVPGATMLDKARHLEHHGDALRKLMLSEPRGYPALCANVILPPTRPEAQAGYVIMEHVEYPGMSGSNTICVVTALLETGMLPMTEPLTELVLEAPAGLIRVTAACAGGKVTGVTFRNVPGVRDASRRPDRGAARRHGRRSTSRTAACSTSSRTPRRSGSGSSPTRAATSPGSPS